MHISINELATMLIHVVGVYFSEFRGTKTALFQNVCC